MTGGSFDGLGAEFNDRDVPIQVGRRPDGSDVPVEGMSDGSRDQLYLTLRLAALVSYSEEHEPKPLILDDLLITFCSFQPWITYTAVRFTQSPNGCSVLQSHRHSPR